MEISYSLRTGIERLDKIDLKIIQLLLINSRISLKNLSIILKRSKEAIRLRIKSLEKKGIITGYPCIIDFDKVDVQRYFFKISLKGTLIEKQNFISSLKRFNELIVFAEVSNEIHLIVFVKSKGMLDSFITKIFLNKMISHLEYSKVLKFHYSPPILFEFEKDKEFKRILSKFSLKPSKGKDINVDVTDLKILKILSEHSNIKLSDLSEKLKIPRDTLKYRINRLLETGIIKSFYIYVELHKLGYTTYIMQIAVSNRTKLDEIINYLQNHSLTNGVTELDNVCNLFTAFYVKDSKEAIKFEEEFLKKFGDAIFEHSIDIFKEQVVLREFPDKLSFNSSKAYKIDSL
ncbi:MAG: winged helix-turn-helix transcriptional regulator [Nanoarchaeota archaeon]